MAESAIAGLLGAPAEDRDRRTEKASRAGIRRRLLASLQLWTASPGSSDPATSSGRFAVDAATAAVLLNIKLILEGKT